MVFSYLTSEFILFSACLNTSFRAWRTGAASGDSSSSLKRVIFSGRAHCFFKKASESADNLSVGEFVAGSSSTRRVTRAIRNLRRSPTTIPLDRSDGIASFKRSSMGTGVMFSPPAVTTMSLMRPEEKVYTVLYV